MLRGLFFPNAGVCMPEPDQTTPATPANGEDSAQMAPETATAETAPPDTAEDAGRKDATAPEPAVDPDATAAPVAKSGDRGFSQPLETAPPPARTFVPGQRVRGKIISIGDDNTIVSFSGRPEAIIPTLELRGPGGAILLRVNDPISATIAALGEPVLLTLGKKRALINAARMRTAFEEKKSVTGIVKSMNKGGFEIRVGGVRAFCPLSQIDNNYVQEPSTHVGQTYSFRVLRWEDGGRNIVLSRRAVLKEEDAARAVETRQRLEVGAEFEGLVTRVQPFGAFVDIGGLEGLLHVSRLGHTHVQDATTVLSPGQKIKVRITRLESAGKGKERIALAATDPGPDPWEEAAVKLREGEVVSGRVVRHAEFGVFVNLLPGIDGLLHISELGERTATPENLAEVVPAGETLQVRVLRLDLERKRVSLSMRLEAEAPRPRPREPRRGRVGRDRERREPQPTSPSPASNLTHTMAEQLGALRQKLQVRP